MDEPTPDARAPDPDAIRTPRLTRVPISIAVGVVAALLLGAALARRAESRTNKIALTASPKRVTVISAKRETFRAAHEYVGTLRPWIEAKVGPQFISAYVETVLVRPGAVVTSGQVLATLDCRNATAETVARSSQARAIAARQLAVSHQAARTRSLLDGGFVSINESELIGAKSDAEAAELAAEQANLARSTLAANDCVLRAPFDGEISRRLVDPGSFVRPATEMLGVVDRNRVRMTADAPESDFDSIAPGASVAVHVVSINVDIQATIARRAPSADPGTRTIHFELDIDNSNRRIPVDTTGEIHVPVGEPTEATAVPLSAVTMNDQKATLFVIDGDVARKLNLVELGEAGPSVFFSSADLKPGTMIVVEGRALLKDNDHVVTSLSPAPPAARPSQRPAGKDESR